MRYGSPSSSSESSARAPAPAAPVISGGADRAPGVRLRAALESLRPHQWLKNLLVFAPLATAHRLDDPLRFGHALRTFIAWCLCASAVYVLNDLIDVQADRAHPHKCMRAIASGRLPRSWAAPLILMLVLSGFAVARGLDPRVSLVLLGYLGVMCAYALKLRDVVLLDVFVLACGYALRVAGGGLAVHIRPSSWLLAFCIFIFLSLALIKRYAELALLRERDGSAAHARAYESGDQELVLVLGVSCGVVAVLVLALYLTGSNVAVRYAHRELIWVAGVLLLYWVSYLWLMAHRGRMSDDPLVFAVHDRVSQALIVVMGLAAWFAV